ncbi:phosphotransferase [Kineosporia babensis]|uniref:Aminoglycoside phosphotransferase family protein n=1 Tax=Kineosporia babensis TaxID=499548 RepID=A0A9X1NBD4_9ACTN|nr:phosphotransferase [Kineosporia babensis]MCD5309933.1 aminoglycoside phosphotransferase family protein [Kineosporia babensis]
MTWQRAQRLDADRLVADLYAQTGVRLVVEGPCAGGEVGAAFVRWAETGRRSVLKWRPHSRLEELQAGPLAVQKAAVQAGIPAPATQLSAQVGHAVAMVQELLPGEKVDLLDEDLLDQALRLNALQAGVLRGREDIPSVKLFLREDGPGYCLHEPLRQHSARGAALERMIKAVPDSEMPAGNDVVHLDFHPGNLLASGKVITGVVDWDGAARGNRAFDLVTLRFGIHHRADTNVTNRLDDVLNQLPESVLKPAWAHMSLRMTDWAIRHHAPTEVSQWFDLAEQRLS